jgi:hypothetical protein
MRAAEAPAIIAVVTTAVLQAWGSGLGGTSTPTAKLGAPVGPSVTKVSFPLGLELRGSALNYVILLRRSRQPAAHLQTSTCQTFSIE